MDYTVPHYINGQILDIVTPHSHAVYNPAFGEPIGKVYFAGKNHCDLAVSAAQSAWPAWAATPPVKRAKILFKFRDLLEQHQSDLAQIVTREQGKTLDDAYGSIARAIEVVEFHCGLMTQLQGALSINVATDIDCATLRQPLGVCAGISPFNFPIMVPIWMMIPAIACGNSFILKPSEQAPSAPIRLVELLTEAGLPAGVVNCIHGNQQTVQCLLTHPDITAITAVASTPVAETIYKTAIARGKRAQTFGGAKNHCVVMPDADLDQAAAAIVGAAYGSAGERCMAISVVVTVGELTAETLITKMRPLIQAIKIDAGDREHVDMGPLISQTHHQHIIAAIEQGVAEGAIPLIDGRSFKHPFYTHGYFIGPTLFDRVKETMSIYQNELFGPVLVIVRVNEFEEALALVNRNQYGNGTAIFTRAGHIAREYSHRVQVGMVGVNIPIPVPIASHPFGGWKRSCFGDTPMHGAESIHFYTHLKTITSKWPVHPDQDTQFTMPIHT